MLKRARLISISKLYQENYIKKLFGSRRRINQVLQDMVYQIFFIYIYLQNINALSKSCVLPNIQNQTVRLKMC